MNDEGCSGWSFFNPACQAQEGVKAVVGDAIENMANAVMEGFGKAVASLGTIWVNIGTPNLSGTGATSSITAGSSAADSGNITTILGYVTWISLAVAVLSLFILGALIATRMRAGEGVATVGRIGLVLAAVVFISGASALVTGLMPASPNNADGAVLFLQSALWWYMGAAAVVSVIIGGARMAWEQRAEPGRETVKSLLTLVVVAGAGVTIVGLLVAAADSFSVWLINGSLNINGSSGCDVAASGSTCFGENMLALLALTTNPAAGGLGSLLIIILGLIAVLAAAFQIVLMVARSGMLVILTGILPLSASFTNTEMGKTWFKKCIAWLVAFILYKPAAAIIYAAAFQLAGTNVFTDDGSGLIAVLAGLMLMIIALFAMPALMRFVTPMVGAMAGGSGGAMAGGAMAALPSGAAAIGRLASGSGSGSSGSSGSEGSSGSQGPTGGQGGGSSGAPSAQSAGSQQGGSSGAAATSGGSSTGTGAGAASAGGGGAAAGGAAAAGGGAAAGAGAGPVGLVAGAALDVAKKVGQGAAGAARSLGEQSTGEGGGPDGSR